MCASDPKVIKVTDNVYILKGMGSMTRLREKLIRRTGSDTTFMSRASVTVNLSDPCSVLTPDSLTFYLVPLYFPCISQSRLVAFLERLPSGRLVALTLAGATNKTSEYLFICALVNHIRDKFPTQAIDSAAFDFLDSQAVHRSVFRMADAVRLLGNSRLRQDGNSVVQLNHVIISGIPLDRASVTLQLIPSIYGNSLVRYFDPAGNVSLTLQLRASESFLLAVSVSGVRLLTYEVLGLSLFQSPFQVISRADFNPKLEIHFPLPDASTLTLVGEVLENGRPVVNTAALHGNPTAVELTARSPRGEAEKRQLVLAALPEFPASGRETSDECQICMEPFREREKLLAFPCLHHFHRHCVEEWTRHKLLCPNCRCDAFELLLRARDS